MNRLVIKSSSQRAEFWSDQELVKCYVISTATNGLGCEVGSYCTPTGRLKVSEKIGADSRIGTIFRSRVNTGEVWAPTSLQTADFENAKEDLVLSRILWLEGLEPHNANTKLRYIYLHGTNHEDKLGQAVSHGCVRFSNNDIIEVFDLLDTGAEVVIE